MSIWIGVRMGDKTPGPTPPPTPAYREVSSGLIIYRKWIRDGKYVIDYSDDGGLTWELDLVVLFPDEDSIIILIDDGVAGCRDLVRGGAYVIDEELTPTGFAGTVDVDWTEVFYTKPI